MWRKRNPVKKSRNISIEPLIIIENVEVVPEFNFDELDCFYKSTDPSRNWMFRLFYTTDDSCIFQHSPSRFLFSCESCKKCMFEIITAWFDESG